MFFTLIDTFIMIAFLSPYSLYFVPLIEFYANYI